MSMEKLKVDLANIVKERMRFYNSMMNEKNTSKGVIDTEYLVAWLELHSEPFVGKTSTATVKSKMLEASKAIKLLVLERNKLRAEVSLLKEIAAFEQNRIRYE